MTGRWYLDYFLDKEAVASFTILTSLTLIVPSILQSFIGTFFIPILYQKENKNRGQTRSFLKIIIPAIFIIFSIAFILIFLFKDTIIIFNR